MSLTESLPLSMSKQHSFIVVSNRLPVNVSREDGKLVLRPSTGGLATAMSSLTSNKLWIGWPGIADDDLTDDDRAFIRKELASYGCYPVFLTKNQIEKFYEGYANDTIWPLFHYFQQYARYDPDYWQAYKDVNKLYMQAVIKQAASDAAIWIHDYHLMLLPRLLRKNLPNASIGFFLHIPFPSYEIFRLLPNRTQILEGLLGADLVGFHVYDYARHFMSSVLRILGVESSRGTIVLGDRVIKVDSFPIGIDYTRYVSALEDSETLEQRKVLDKLYRGQKVILSMDRLDYSKGIESRLKAFEQFLQQNPSAHQKVSMVMVAVPSRTEVETYRELRQDIERTVSRINGTFGTVGWTPIAYHFKNLPFPQIVALQARADIALITPLRDGMNLVAKEYIATKQKGLGVLILSEMTGAIDELPEALRVNPNNTDSIVAAIRGALDMPKKEQQRRLASMQGRLSRYTVQRWAKDFMDELHATKRAQADQGSRLLTQEREDKLLRLFGMAKKRLLLLDYDGTLRGFAAGHEPHLAAPTVRLKRLIQEVALIPRTLVCIVSGRPRAALDEWFGDLPVALAAEHGAWMKYDGEWSRQQVSLHEHKDRLLPLLELYVDRTPGARIEQKDLAIVWHYRGVPAELAHARNASLRHELERVLENTDVSVHAGNKILEIKPDTVHKGAVAEDLFALHNPDFALSIGDDYTDEDMFKAMPDEAFSIKVGLGDTAARYQVLGIDDVLRLLKQFTAAAKK